MSNQTLFPKLSDIDQFVVVPSVNVQGKDRIGSRIGFFLTILAIISLVGVSIYFVVKLFTRSQTILVQSELLGGAQDEQVYVNFTFGINYQGTYLVDPNIFRVEASLSVNSSFSYPLQAQPCSVSGHDVYCITMGNQTLDDNELYVLGDDRYIAIAIYPCINDETTTTCLPFWQIKQIFTDSDWIGYYDDWIVNPYNHTNPISPTQKSRAISLTDISAKIINLFVGKIDFTSDNNFFFESEHTQSVSTVETIEVDWENLYNLGWWMNINIHSSGNKVIYNRRYTKIQEVISEIFGLTNAVLLILSIILLPYAQFKMKETLANTYFETIIIKEVQPEAPKIKSPHRPQKDHQTKNKNTKEEVQYNEPDIQKSPQILFKLKKRNSPQANPSIHRNQNKLSSGVVSEAHIEPITLNQVIQNMSSEEESIKIAALPKIEKSTPAASSCENDIHLHIAEDADEEQKLEDGLNVDPFSRQNQPKTVHLSKSVDMTHYHRNEKPKSASPNIVYTKMQSNNTNSETEMMQTRNHPEALNIPEEEDKNPEELHFHAKEDFPEDFPERHLDLEAPRIPPAQKSNPKIDISFIQWMFSCFRCRPQRQMMMLKKAEEQLSKNIDLITLAKKTVQCDKLMELLLTQEQKILLEDLLKPELVFNPVVGSNSPDSIQIVDWLAPKKGNNRELQEVYETLKTSINKSSIDLKLLSAYERKYFGKK